MQIQCHPNFTQFIMFARTELKQQPKRWQDDPWNRIVRDLFPLENEETRMAVFTPEEQSVVKRIEAWLKNTEPLSTEDFLLIQNTREEMVKAALKNVFKEPISMYLLGFAREKILCYYCADHTLRQTVLFDGGECSYDRAYDMMTNLKYKYCNICHTNLYRFICYDYKRDF